MPLNDVVSREENLKKTEYYHTILVKGLDFSSAQKRVLHFFERYQLVRYSHIEVLREKSLNASQASFSKALEAAVARNHEIIHDLVDGLKTEEIIMVEQFTTMQQGYQSKMLHVLTHFLDGFFGIDTYFYNLEEDSHWVSENLQKTVLNNAKIFWLIFLKAKI